MKTTTYTTNGMAAFGELPAALELFAKSGTLRDNDAKVARLYAQAIGANPEFAGRLALYIRDVRGGAGERKIFRNMLGMLADTDLEMFSRVLAKVPEVGRWDDLFKFKTKNPSAETAALMTLAAGIKAKHGLAAKWSPREKSSHAPVARKLAKLLGMTPIEYRKHLVANTNVVETQMCANDWDNINFNHVPSQAIRIYRNAFKEKASHYAAWTEALKSGSPEAKVNAGAVFPHDITRMLDNRDDHALADAQWKAQPNWVEGCERKILALVDVSGSMQTPVGGTTGVSCMDVAVALGLYLSERSPGVFKDHVITFETQPSLVQIKGANLYERVCDLHDAPWGGSTNFERALDLILKAGQKHNIAQADMPDTLFVFSDMQFDAAADQQFDEGAALGVQRKFAAAGYKAPEIVFWNLADRGNSPADSGCPGVSLVGGFSPATMKHVLQNGTGLTPTQHMLETLSNARYDI